MNAHNIGLKEGDKVRIKKTYPNHFKLNEKDPRHKKQKPVTEVKTRIAPTLIYPTMDMKLKANKQILTVEFLVLGNQAFIATEGEAWPISAIAEILPQNNKLQP